MEESVHMLMISSSWGTMVTVTGYVFAKAYHRCILGHLGRNDNLCLQECISINFKDFSVFLSQENFCNDLRPITIDNERQRPKDDQLTSREISQCRGLIMKAQWRAIQTAPQYCCRIGLASSALTKPTLATMKEANAIVKELREDKQRCFAVTLICW